MGKKRVTALGGIFFKCEEPQKLRDWYQQHLGLKTDPYGATFEWRNADEPETKGQTVWALLKRIPTISHPPLKISCSTSVSKTWNGCWLN